MSKKKNWLRASMLIVGLCAVLMMYGVSASKPGDLIKDTMRNATVNTTEGLGKEFAGGFKHGMGLTQFALMGVLIFIGMVAFVYGAYGLFKTQKEGDRVGSSSLSAWVLVILGIALIAVGAMFSDLIAKIIGI